MKIEIPDFQSEDRAVSPVIGVILMVAITVILAAVIGAFVLDLGSQLGSSGPTAQIAVADADEAFGNGANFATVEHKGGDDLNRAELKVIIQQDGSTVAIDSDLSTSAFDSTDFAWQSTPSTEISVGEAMVIQDSGATTGVPGSGPGSEYTVKMVHKPSGSVVASSKVEIN